LSFHDFFIEFVDLFLELNRLDALRPLTFGHSDFIQTLGHLTVYQVLKEWLGIKQVSLEKIELSS
jgi:hypothetical protein